MSPTRISDANYHLGHLFLDSMRRKKDGICQIDAATGQEETYASVLNRSIRLATALRALGLKPGDVLAIGGKNHLDLHIPYYAGLMNGLPLVGVDPQFQLDEISSLFKLTQPKIAFCDSGHYSLYVKVADSLDLDTRVVSFSGKFSMAELISSYVDNHELIEDFQPAIFDLEKVYAWLLSTGGTTGVMKFAAIKHKKLFKMFHDFVTKMVKPVKNIIKENMVIDVALNLSSVQWVSGFINALGVAVTNQIKLQTSGPYTAEHIIDVINKYRPTSSTISRMKVKAILEHDKKCDFTCFNSIYIGGSKIYKDFLIELRKKMRDDALVMEVYGQSENIGLVFIPNPKGPLGNCGQKNAYIGVKLMDPETGLEVKEPFVPGELWTDGATFTEYYNDPEKTAQMFTEDGWFKSGDLFYRDKEWNFYFVERIKMLIKYKNYRVAPLELEEVIRGHKGVHDVAVTAVPDAVSGELPAACVVKRKGSSVTARDIESLIASKLSDHKHLRGGVVFVDEIPVTSVEKVVSSKIRQIVLAAARI